MNKLDRNNLKFDRLYKKIIKDFTTITTGIYKNEFWKFRKQIETIRNSLDMLYHTYLNLMMTGEIELNDINKEMPEWAADPQGFLNPVITTEKDETK